MFFQKRNKRGDGVEAERVVAEIDGVQVRAFEKGGEEGREGRGDLGQEAGGENVREVDDFKGFLGAQGGGDGFGGWNAKGIAVEANFGDGLGRGKEGGDVGSCGCSGVEFKGLVGEGEDVGRGHDGINECGKVCRTADFCFVESTYSEEVEGSGGRYTINSQLRFCLKD